MASIAGVFALALAVVACGGSNSNSSSKPAKTASTASRPATTLAPTSTSAPPTTTQGAATLQTANSGLGMILVDGSGKTLYAFAMDSGTTSACTGGCASIWSPLMASGPASAGAGVDAAKLSTAPSGQVLYGGHLLYRYSADSAPGDTKGQGLGGIWHVVAPSGDIVT
jgi:predicted lipoprotein with Yx(FWY)xxD motif